MSELLSNDRTHGGRIKNIHLEFHDYTNTLIFPYTFRCPKYLCY